MTEKKENLQSEANQSLVEKALDYIKRYSGDTETLRISREDALKAYRRDPYPEDARIPDGSRSKFVMSDLADTIEWILPSLMRIFYSGKEVVKIEGQGPEDESRMIVGPDGMPKTINPAGLLNEKVNWDFQRQNNGFLVLYDWFKASMLNKFSVVKYWWDNHDEYREESLDDLTDDAFGLLAEDKDFIIDSHEETEVSPELAIDGMVLQPRIVSHQVKGRKISKRVRRPVAEVVPPEEFICSLKARDLKTEEFYAHRKRIHKADLMSKYDLSEDDIERQGAIFADTNQHDSEIYERFKDLGGTGFFRDEDDNDFYYIYECYLKDKDRQDTILTIFGTIAIGKQENNGAAGFCLNSPIRMPHRAIGMSIFDIVGDLQKLRTALARFILNNIYYQTDGMLVVNPWKINIADFVTQRRPGGIIRTKDSSVNVTDAVWPVPVQPLAGHAFGLLEAIEGWKENRTGVTRYNQGMNADTLNKTARGISEIMAASQQRIELIARIFAETGVRDLMMAFARMNLEFLDVETNIRLDQDWIAVDKTMLDVDFDVTVDVALGTGSAEMRVQQVGAMLDRSMNPTLIASGVVQPPNVYELMKTIYLEMGYKNVDKYITNPSTLVPNVNVGANQGLAGPAGAGVPAGPPELAGVPAAA